VSVLDEMRQRLASLEQNLDLLSVGFEGAHQLDPFRQAVVEVAIAGGAELAEVDPEPSIQRRLESPGELRSLRSRSAAGIDRRSW
jgi:hypothetical protein